MFYDETLPMRIAPGHPASGLCLPDSNPYGRDGLAHSRSRVNPRGRREESWRRAGRRAPDDDCRAVGC